jgi:hypothetical protein
MTSAQVHDTIVQMLDEAYGPASLMTASNNGETSAHLTAGKRRDTIVRALGELCGPTLLLAADSDGNTPAHHVVAFKVRSTAVAVLRAVRECVSRLSGETWLPSTR